MKLSRPVLSRISEMICGNEGFDHFPYRSSSKLTKFFFDLDLDYVHDGSTRALWVQEVLNSINEIEGDNQTLPNRELVKVITSIANPDYFLFDETLSHSKAIEDLNKVLKSSKLILKEKSDGQYSLSTLTGDYISTEIVEPDAIQKITFTPSVFKIPNKKLNQKLISVMMPFNSVYRGTYDAVKRVANHMNLECLRADNIWENSTFMQDIFELIFCSKIVIVDFTGRNPNVMYETGIAHTLGKIVIPITQSIDDIPSDVGHHRALKYLPNDEGYRNLSNELYKRIKSIMGE